MPTAPAPSPFRRLGTPSGAPAWAARRLRAPLLVAAGAAVSCDTPPCVHKLICRFNTPPAVAITAPGDDERLAAGVEVELVAMVRDNEQRADELELVWLDGEGAEVARGAASKYGDALLPLGPLPPGAYTYTLRVLDREAAVSTDTVDFVVAPPLELALSPARPRTDDPLVAVLTEGGAPLDAAAAAGLAFTWTEDGAPLDVATDTLPPDATVKGRTYAVTVRRGEGSRALEEVSASVVVENTPPGPPALALTPDAPEAGGALRCAITDESDDLDGDAVDYTFVWTVDGAPFTEALTGAHTGDSLPVEVWSVASAWACTVSPHDDEADGEPATVTGGPPVAGDTGDL